MRVLFFAQLKDVTGCDSAEITPAPAMTTEQGAKGEGRRAKGEVGSEKDEEVMAVPAMTTEQLWGELLKKFPKLAAHRANVRLARNWEYAGPDARFADADEVALIPPVSGG